MHARVRQGQAGVVALQVGVNQQIQVDDARRVAKAAFPAELELDGQQRVEQRVRRETGFDARHGVDEIGLVGVAHRRVQIQRRARQHTRIG